MARGRRRLDLKQRPRFERRERHRCRALVPRRRIRTDSLNHRRPEIPKGLAVTASGTAPRSQPPD